MTTLVKISWTRLSPKMMQQRYAHHIYQKGYFSTTITTLQQQEKEKVGIVMLNMGGPSTLHGKEDGVEAFLTRLFSDGEIIKLGPLQRWLVCL